jgi:predicted 3-demethylubiquinone-9 3-methyltransferase (glyoxalase superfamily)
MHLRLALAALSSVPLFALAPRAVEPAPPPPVRVSTHLMFQGRAEEAMDLYVSLFEGAEVTSLERNGAEGPGAEGSLSVARVRLPGQELVIYDSPIKHQFTFTPSTSLFVECDAAAEVDRLVAELSKEGETMMPLGEYPFSPHFAWISDRFGVSWQIGVRAPAAKSSR